MSLVNIATRHMWRKRLSVVWSGVVATAKFIDSYLPCRHHWQDDHTIVHYWRQTDKLPHMFTKVQRCTRCSKLRKFEL